MAPNFRVLVLLSGRGSNCAALLKQAKLYTIIGIISDNSAAPGLALAGPPGIAAQAFPRADYPSRAAQQKAIFEACRASEAHAIALAGFMQILPAYFVEHFSGRLINIHPSLLPSFPGLHTHHQALQAGAREHGCSVHYVDSGVDTGPLIAQAKCPCYPEDTEETLAARVLEREHQLYPWVLNNIAAGKIALRNNRVRFDTSLGAEAAARNFILHGESHGQD